MGSTPAQRIQVAAVLAVALCMATLSVAFGQEGEPGPVVHEGLTLLYEGWPVLAVFGVYGLGLSLGKVVGRA